MTMATIKAAQINLRVSAPTVADLDALAEYDHVTRVDVARQILLEGIAQRKRNLALRLYREGRASKSRAAEIAGISLWEMLDLIDRTELAGEYSAEQAVEDVRRLFAKAPR